MKLIAVSGLKGGVGASTVAANLASGIHSINQNIAIVDFDLRNFLRMYFSMKMSDRDGWASREHCGEDWTFAFHQSPAGLRFLPFGSQAVTDISDKERPDNDFFSNPQLVYKLSNRYFSEMLATLSEQFDYVVVHLPSLHCTSRFKGLLQELHSAVDMHVVVINPDAACYSLLDTLGDSISRLPKVKLLANKCFSSSSVSVDFSFYIKKAWGGILISNPIHFDEALAEATANLQTVSGYSPGSLATEEFKTLALWSLATLSSDEGRYA